MEINIKLNDYYKKIYKKAHEVLDYKTKKDNETNLEDLFDLIENLSDALEYKQTELKELENDLIENYKPKCNNEYLEYGVSEYDFC